ncbi:hypothetical protein RRG08_028278 [Elysia crispata]|uniref:Uncharacterized protein n=1 Tax=Elysia crispata TaxID=231223 RepID=A0AAE1E5K4_9GAST|nr:hypothetical protein RRG08_028278 [Elysia crispata]
MADLAQGVARRFCSFYSYYGKGQGWLNPIQLSSSTSGINPGGKILRMPLQLSQLRCPFIKLQPCEKCGCVEA